MFKAKLMFLLRKIAHYFRLITALLVYKELRENNKIRLSDLTNNIWPIKAEIAFTKMSFQARILEEINLFYKYRNYLSGVDLFLDVGANVGMTSIAYYYFSAENSKIIAIEPMAGCNEILENIANQIPECTYLNCGLGSSNCEMQLNVNSSSKTSQASSFLDYTSKYKTYADHANAPIGKKTVAVRKLDSVLNDANKTYDSICLHIDVEGFEMQVLKGSENSLKSIKVIIVEVTNNLFVGQSNISEIVNFLSPSHSLVGTLGAPMMANSEIIGQDYLFVRLDDE